MDKIWGCSCGHEIEYTFYYVLLMFLVNINEDENGKTITKTFQKTSDESYRESIKIWVDKGSEFYKRSMKSELAYNNIEIY